MRRFLLICQRFIIAKLVKIVKFADLRYTEIVVNKLRFLYTCSVDLNSLESDK